MFSQRLFIMRVFILAAFLVFIGRLAYLQLVKGAELRDTSKKNHQRWVRSTAPRGLVLDRKGRILAKNVQALTAWLVPGEVPREQWDHLQQRLVAIGLFPDAATAEAEITAYRASPGYIPVRLKSRLTLQTVTRLEEEMAFLPGVYLRAEPIRSYPNGQLAAHVLGFLREIDQEDLAARREKGYRLGDRIGKAGIERYFEDELRGIEGGEELEVDAYGRVLRTLSRRTPREGTKITLTLDADIQRTAEQALHGYSGAAVALDPANGDILALASAPSYDLNRMSGRISGPMLAWLRGGQAPERNRATSGRYPPGSVFKIITAAAALEKNRVNQDRVFYCDGAYYGIHCWKRSGHGALSLTGAIAESCNVAFMKMAKETGIAELSAMARRFGLGEHTGVAYLPEASGLVPDQAWVQKVHRRKWEMGETLQVGIGQSYLMITPLQSARIAAAIANGGKLVHPRLVLRTGELDIPQQDAEPIGLKPQTLQRITRGLRAVANVGTARQLDASLRIAGKTGTAQNPGGNDHAWFVGFAPADQPKIAVAVLVEHGGHGGAVAAPIAEAIIRTALNGPPPPSPQLSP